MQYLVAIFKLPTPTWMNHLKSVPMVGRFREVLLYIETSRLYFCICISFLFVDVLIFPWWNIIFLEWSVNVIAQRTAKSRDGRVSIMVEIHKYSKRYFKICLSFFPPPPSFLPSFLSSFLSQSQTLTFFSVCSQVSLWWFLHCTISESIHWILTAVFLLQSGITTVILASHNLRR